MDNIRRLVRELHIVVLPALLTFLAVSMHTQAYFDSNVLGYSTADCGGENPPPIWATCLFVCPSDPACQVLGFNRSVVSCGCGCQACKAADGTIQIYGAVSDPVTPLTEAQVEDQCPHAHAGCSGVTYPEPPSNPTKRATIA